MLRPFPGLIIEPAWADRVTTGPYDAYSPSERVAIAESNPYSFLNVTRSQEDVPVEWRDDVDWLIGQCAESMQRIYDAGAYAEHDEPSLFLYRLEAGGHVQTGVMGLVPVTEPGDRRVLRHEAVRPGRADLLTRHLLEVGMSSSPISLTYRTDAVLDAAIVAGCATEPVLEADGDGIHQTAWALSGEAADALVAAMGDRPLYVTDGHHRLAAAVEARHRNPDIGDDHPLQWTQAVLFPDAEMQVLAAHRRVGDRAGRSTDDLVEALTAIGPLTPCADVAEARPDGAGAIGVYVGGRWFSMDLPAASGSRAVDQLDVSRLQDGILAPVMDITDPGSDPMIDYVPEPVGIGALVARCDADGRVGFVLHATSVTEMMAVADEDGLMPPKSSYFEPKPRSGVFVRRLDRETTTGAGRD
ncbi:MAG: DUF1015 domain-containing protein [Acidimicrobiaceae bacterium]|nr:DUF1015 domain-containing protein [Acidimicrobiaceae bacterium]